MLYLNERGKDFEGGSTYFVDPKTRKITKLVSPSPGMAIVFAQEDIDYLHGGEELKKGVKYILRSGMKFYNKLIIIDVIYTCA